ncbi:MAG: hypothetical protein ACRDHY_01875 [Anaerolineales bacterium]
MARRPAPCFGLGMTVVGPGVAGALLTTLLGVALGAPGPSGGWTVAAGLGEATYWNCAPGSDHAAIVGFYDGSAWSFVVGDVRSDPLHPCAFGNGESFRGAWDPDAGGCIHSAVAGKARQLCLENPVSDGGFVVYELSLTVFLMSTAKGRASLVLA